MAHGRGSGKWCLNRTISSPDPCSEFRFHPHNICGSFQEWSTFQSDFVDIYKCIVRTGCSSRMCGPVARGDRIDHLKGRMDENECHENAQTRLLRQRINPSARLKQLFHPSHSVCNMVLIVDSSRRIAVKPFTFSNGVSIPPGTSVASPLMPIHMDETIYSDPWTFDPFRFSRKRELQGESAKHHAANTSLEYLYFGYGHHAWYH